MRLPKIRGKREVIVVAHFVICQSPLINVLKDVRLHTSENPHGMYLEAVVNRDAKGKSHDLTRGFLVQLFYLFDGTHSLLVPSHVQVALTESVIFR